MTAYERFLASRGVSIDAEPSRAEFFLARLDQIEANEARIVKAIRNAPTQMDVRRGEARLDRLADERVRLLSTLEAEYPPESIAALQAARLNLRLDGRRFVS